MDIARHLRVLVVDDNEGAAKTLAGLVAARGYEVHTAFSGLTALIQAKDFRPDIVLWGFSDTGRSRLRGHGKPASPR
jgi:PleD family two-component response regulator